MRDYEKQPDVSAINSSDVGAPGRDDIIKNLTEERDMLKRKLNIFGGWLYFKDSFYYIFPVKKPWQESQDDCRQRGADLVIVNSREEQDFLREFRRVTWIGLSDRETEGTWEWVDGTLLNKSFWKTGEPNNYGGRDEDCGTIQNYEQFNNWNDTPCKSENFWICEKIVDH
ncbi:CD209 antigen-like protein E [Mugil cephalus]|uniref:CD209 antigen-like protein E n=1 Tax=Mugil cephalus TaxID=48193 RepID=UPI001FB7F584|nr:CD209 antigen-like protein E [Mugil cephalus]